MLGRNPGAYGVPETNLALFDTMDVMLRELTGLRGTQLHGVIRTLAQLLSGEQTHASVEMAWRWVLNHLHWPTGWTRDFIGARIAPLRMVERNTSALFDVDAATRLADQVAQADFVHITRHPRSHGNAIMADGHGAAAALLGSYDTSVQPEMLDPQFLWVRAERAIDGFLAQIPDARVHRLRAEDLLDDPDATLTTLCTALDLPTDTDALTRMRHPEAGPFARPGPIGAHLGDFPDFLRNPHMPSADPLAQLAGRLEWRDDGSPFLPETLNLARARGYS